MVRSVVTAQHGVVAKVGRIAANAP